MLDLAQPTACRVEDALRRQPIHFAATCATDAPLQLLLKKGAERRVEDKLKRTPLVYAAMAGRANNIRFLMGCKLSAQDAPTVVVPAALKTHLFKKELLLVGKDLGTKIAPDGVAVLSRLLVDAVRQMLVALADVPGSDEDRLQKAAIAVLKGEMGVHAKKLADDTQQKQHVDTHGPPALAKKLSETSEDNLSEMFKKIDKDGDGSLDRDELLHVFESIGVTLPPDEFDAEIVSKMDTDSDGNVSFDEFCFWMLSGAKHADTLRAGVVKGDMPQEEVKEAQAYIKSNKIPKEPRFDLTSVLDSMLATIPKEQAKLDAETCAYTSSVIQYIAEELVELSGNAARDQRKTSTKACHVFTAVSRDDEISALFPPDSPVMNSVLLPMKDKEGYAALHHAVSKKHVDAVEVLLELDADVNQAGPSSKSALALAAEVGSTDLIKLLISRGAKIDSRDKRKRTPLLLAVRAGRTAACSVLLRYGADPDAVDSSGNAVAHYAAAFGQAGCIRLLAEAGCNFSAESDMKLSPIITAFKKDHRQVVTQLLTECNINVNLKNADGKTLLQNALEVLSKASLDQIFFLLDDRKADATISDAAGNSVLHTLATAQIAADIPYVSDKGGEATRINQIRGYPRRATTDRSAWFVDSEMQCVQQPEPVEERKEAGDEALWVERLVQLCARLSKDDLRQPMKTCGESLFGVGGKSRLKFTKHALWTWPMESKEDLLKIVKETAQKYTATASGGAAKITSCGTAKKSPEGGSGVSYDSNDAIPQGPPDERAYFKTFRLCIRKQVDQLSSAQVVFNQLSDEDRAAVWKLGWTVESWYAGHNPTKTWSELSDAERKAAQTLGCAASQWKSIPVTIVDNTKPELETFKGHVLCVNEEGDVVIERQIPSSAGTQQAQQVDPSLVVLESEDVTTVWSQKPHLAVACAQKLVARGADINAKNKEQETPLLIAVRHGQVDLARYLIEQGADVSACSFASLTVLMAAVSNTTFSWGKGIFHPGSLVDILLDRVTVDHINAVTVVPAKSRVCGTRALSVALGCGAMISAAKLLAKGAAICYAENGKNPVHMYFANMKVFEPELIFKSASPEQIVLLMNQPSAPNPAGSTPPPLATPTNAFGREPGHKGLLLLLLQYMKHVASLQGSTALDIKEKLARITANLEDFIERLPSGIEIISEEIISEDYADGKHMDPGAHTIVVCACRVNAHAHVCVRCGAHPRPYIRTRTRTQPCWRSTGMIAVVLWARVPEGPCIPSLCSLSYTVCRWWLGALRSCVH